MYILSKQWDKPIDDKENDKTNWILDRWKIGYPNFVS